MPIWGDMQKKMLEAYRSTGAQTPSAYALWQLFPEIVADLRVMARKEKNDFVMLELLWAIPQRLLEALIKQTVDYDYYMANVSHDVTRTSGPGIYVATVSLPSRKGKWLSPREIAQAIRHIRNYMSYGAFVTHLNKRADASKVPINKLTNREIEKLISLTRLHKAKWIDGVARADDLPDPKALTPILRQKLLDGVAFVRTVDGQCCGVNGWNCDIRGSRWMPWDDETGFSKGMSRCNRLVNMLRRRLPLDTSLTDIENAATGTYDELQIQSPQYAGCGNILSEREKAYRLSNLDRVNKHMAILCCVLSHMGESPHLSVRCVLRTWKTEQFRVAEQLVVTLGRTLVWQDGYNSEEGGGQMPLSTIHQLSSARVAVLGTQHTLSVNLDHAEADVEARLARLAQSTGVEKRLDVLEADINELKGKLGYIARMVQLLGGESGHDDMADAVARMGRQNDRLRSACITFEAASRWMGLLLEKDDADAARVCTDLVRYESLVEDNLSQESSSDADAKETSDDLLRDAKRGGDVVTDEGLEFARHLLAKRAGEEYDEHQ
ncbi:hypothetical protein ACHAQA_010035 [Verticillium albo-atrum]